MNTPPATDKHNTVKQQLLELYNEIEESKARQLLKTCRMDDEKLSRFLHRLRSLARKGVSETILTSIFLEQLTPNLNNILVASAHTDLAMLVTIADKILEFRTPHLAAIIQTTTATPVTESKQNKRTRYKWRRVKSCRYRSRSLHEK